MVNHWKKNLGNFGEKLLETSFFGVEGEGGVFGETLVGSMLSSMFHFKIPENFQKRVKLTKDIPTGKK